MKKYILSLIGIGFLFGSLNAQSVLEYYEKTPTAEDDNIYIKHHYNTNRVVPYSYLREADVMWQKRVQRLIPLKEKMNHALYYPVEEIKDRKSLWQILKNVVITEGSVTAYRDEEFNDQITPEEVKAKITSIDTIDIYVMDDEGYETGEIIQELVENSIQDYDVVEYMIKEDWFFDKQRSVMEVRILGICPMAYNKDETGLRTKQQLFWIWFPELRSHLATAEVFNPGNDAERRTFDEIFHLRKFSSVIKEESNVYSRTIYDYNQMNRMEQLLEAERIKEEIRNFEHDLWEY